MDKKFCIGCRENFYNGNNPLGIKECWHLKDAKLITKYCIGINVPMNRKENFTKVKVPNCYTEPGYAHIGDLPDHLR